MLYLPGITRSRGKLYSPCALLTTHVVIVEPSFLAPMRTPSIVPSAADMTFPVNAGAGDVCAAVKHVAKTKASKAVAFFIGSSIVSYLNKKGAQARILIQELRSA